MGKASRHIICHSEQPSTIMDSKSSLGTSRSEFDRMRIVNGSPNAIAGSISAGNVS